ncbi:hypothetical protein AKJ16_DCAP06192 [Drosera capensis]
MRNSVFMREETTDAMGEDCLSNLEWKEKKHHETVTEDEDFGTVNNVNGNKFKAEHKMGLQKDGKQLIKRSNNMIAKQVISVQTELSLGFASQLWVDTTHVLPLEKEKGQREYYLEQSVLGLIV